jgi:sterol desaturase/sphingolipid hydroxylase (fatty acid hydroxylase superfamily)
MTALVQILALALPFALLERSRRLRFRKAPFLRPFFASDVAYLVTGYAAAGALTLAWTERAARWLGSAAGLPRLSEQELPLALTAALALVAIDLGNYAAHWLLHRVGFLWELHKVHHSSPRLDWLATFRSHVLEQALRRLVAPLLLVAAGFPTPAVTIGAGIQLAFAIVNHANLSLPLRWLEPVFVTPRLHRVHHVPETSERNLGTVFSLWDRLRGTLDRADPDAQTRFGVPGELDRYPQGFLPQLVEPWRRRTS